MKLFRAKGYTLLFDPKSGVTVRYGDTVDEDPVMCPSGPEILDIEVSTICNGLGKPCSWCYKSNSRVGENMSFKTFQAVLDKFPPPLTQIAIGIGDIDANPELFLMMEYARLKGVVPNITINGARLWRRHIDTLAKLCGAVSVSHYGDDDLCFDAIDALSIAGLEQINIHKLLSEETYASCFDLLDKAAKDPRLVGKMKAIVFLLLKPKGAHNKMHGLRSLESYQRLMDHAKKVGVAVGMDSCSAPMALKTLPPETLTSIEPCESTLFSLYVNVKGEAFPCSFTEGTPNWETGISLVDKQNFTEEVWNSSRLREWRRGLLGSNQGCSACPSQKHCRSCPVYDITVCKKASP